MYRLGKNDSYVIKTDTGKEIYTDDPLYMDFLKWRDGWVETLEDGTEIIHEPNTPLPYHFSWPVITKYMFCEKLLTPIQKFIWDNYDLLKAELGLTDEQFMQLRSFKASFDRAEKVTMDDDLMVEGLSILASWNLTYNEDPVFTQEDVDRILSGQPLYEALTSDS